MIVSDRLRFVFIHVPKCAGTSVRVSIAQFHDADPRYLKAIVNDPVHGMIDYRHMPLSLMAQVAPEVFSRLKTHATYAIVRDPIQRFQSAMAQRTKMYLGREFAQMGSAEIKAEISRVTSYLVANPQVRSPDFIHFSRQSDFIQLDGERMIKNIFPVERLDLFSASIGQLVGDKTVPIGHDNRTRIFRYPQVKSVAILGRDLSRRLMPDVLHELMRRSARKMLMKPKDQVLLPEFAAPAITEFIHAHYARDFELYRTAMTEVDATRATG